MTTDEAIERMTAILSKHRGDRKKQRKHGEKLLCEILRMTGYWRTAELYERIKGK